MPKSLIGGNSKARAEKHKAAYGPRPATYTREELEAKKYVELRDLLQHLGVEPSPSLKKAELVDLLLEVA